MPRQGRRRAADGLRAAAALGALASLLGCKSKDKPAPADEAVTGTFVSDHLGVLVDFPAGWMHRRVGDRLTDPEGRERGSEFYAGAAADPAVALSLRLTEPTPGAPPFSEMSEEIMLRSARGGSAHFAESAGADVSDCEVVELGGRMTGRCIGSITAADRAVRVYFFAVGDYLGSVIALHAPDRDGAEIDQIAGSVRARKAP